MKNEPRKESHCCDKIFFESEHIVSMAEIFFESEQQVWLHVVWCDVEIRRRVRKILSSLVEARQQERQIKIMRTLAALFLFLLLIYSLYLL